MGNTPTFVVELRTPGRQRIGFTPSMEWRVRKSYRGAGYGRPTEANLAKYVEKYNASLQPGECNAHIGPLGRATSARIRYNVGSEVVTTWQAPAFEVV